MWKHRRASKQFLKYLFTVPKKRKIVFLLEKSRSWFNEFTHLNIYMYDGHFVPKLCTITLLILISKKIHEKAEWHFFCFFLYCLTYSAALMRFNISFVLYWHGLMYLLYSGLICVIEFKSCWPGCNSKQWPFTSYYDVISTRLLFVYSPLKIQC